jgi:hypothetical protein
MTHIYAIRAADEWARRRGYNPREASAGSYGRWGHRFFYGPNAHRKALRDLRLRP